MRLHRGGRWRAWLGARFGGDAELGDRIWRRCLHFGGVLVLLYYLLPPVIGPLSAELALLLALAAVLVLEGMRHAAGWELPTIRPWESRRVASYAYFAVALVAVVLLIPEPIAVAAVLGVSFVDPLLGELRLRRVGRPLASLAGAGVYVLLGFSALVLVGRWSGPGAAVGALVAAVVGVAVESPRWAPIDDDLAMTVVPAVTLWLIVTLAPGLPAIPW